MKFQITRPQWLVELNKYIERIIPVTDSCSRDNSQMDLATLLLLLLQQMLQCRVILYVLQLVGDNLFHFGFDTVVVLLYHLLHAVIVVLVPVGNNRDRLVRLLLLPDLFGIHHNLAMENLLFDALAEVIRYRADKHTLRKP